MEYFYYFTIAIAFLALFNKKMTNVVLVLGCAFFLYYLPSIEYYSSDYFGYEDAYEGALFLQGYPWISSSTRIDAEQLYLAYTGAIKLYSGQDFPFFLITNFLICVFVSHFILKNFNPFIKQFFWLMLLPVIFPTIFYNLVRSSLSLFMVALGFVSFLHLNKKRAIFLGILFTSIGFNLHSQYILISILFILTYFILRFHKSEDYIFNINFILTFSVFLIFGLLLTKSFVEELSTLLSVIPASDLATSKLGYLEVEDTRGIRITSILSIVVYPYMAYQVLRIRYWDPSPFILKSKNKERKFLFMFFAIICYTAAINIAYYDSAHLASRLGRFSDYLGMGVLIPLYFRVCIGLKLEYIVLIVFAIIAPVIYSSIYIDYH